MDKRTILWYMVFLGFAINYMIRMNINIAIVSMIKHSKKNTNITVVSECSTNDVSFKYNTTFAQQSPMDRDNDNKFEWNEYQQNAILGAFSVTHIIMQIPGGVLAQRYGTKAVFGLSNGLSALLSFAVPISAKINYETLVVIRLLQGFISGGAWPSMHTMTAKWIPSHERSRFVSAYLGSSMGTAVTYIMCGYLIAAFGWESVFYVSGGLGLVWIICWVLFVYDTPAKHPTISTREKTYIENCLGNTIQNTSKSLSIPWKSLLLSKPILINLLTQFGGLWGMFTLSTQGPTYFKFVLGLNIKQTGLWSGMPHLFRWMFSFGFGTICDHLIKTKMMSMANVRKFATFFCNIVQGLFILGLCFSGCNSMLAVVMLISATAVNGAVSSGSLAAAIDLAPNYAGVIQGVIGCICTSSGFISPIIVGYLTYNQQTLTQWNKVFYLSGAICITSGLVYILFGTSSVQKWNAYANPDPNEKEMKLMINKYKGNKSTNI